MQPPSNPITALCIRHHSVMGAVACADFIGGHMDYLSTTRYSTRNTQRRERREAVVVVIGFSLIMLLLAFI